LRSHHIATGSPQKVGSQLLKTAGPGNETGISIGEYLAVSIIAPEKIVSSCLRSLHPLLENINGGSKYRHICPFLAKLNLQEPGLGELSSWTDEKKMVSETYKWRQIPTEDEPPQSTGTLLDETRNF
jgi:hypothetical protein